MCACARVCMCVHVCVHVCAAMARLSLGGGDGGGAHKVAQGCIVDTSPCPSQPQARSQDRKQPLLLISTGQFLIEMANEVSRTATLQPRSCLPNVILFQSSSLGICFSH